MPTGFELCWFAPVVGFFFGLSSSVFFCAIKKKKTLGFKPQTGFRTTQAPERDKQRFDASLEMSVNQRPPSFLTQVQQLADQCASVSTCEEAKPYSAQFDAALQHLQAILVSVKQKPEFTAEVTPLMSVTEQMATLHVDASPPVATVAPQTWTAPTCPDCKNADHIFKDCPKFRKLKQKVTKGKYTGQWVWKSAALCDLDGFCAAGLAIVRESSANGMEVLLAQEWREQQMRFNFIGGKRDSLKEHPYDTAWRELCEETSFVRGREHANYAAAIPRCGKDMFLDVRFMWDPVAKYFFLIGIAPNAPDVPQHVTWNAEVVNICWKPIAQLQTSDFHVFAHPHLEELQSDVVQTALEKMFSDVKRGF